MSAAPDRRVTYRTPLRQKGIRAVPKEVLSELADDEDVIFEWRKVDDCSGSYLVTPLGTHQMQHRWFYTDEWLEGEHQATVSADRGEGQTLSVEEAFAEAIADARRRVVE